MTTNQPSEEQVIEEVRQLFVQHRVRGSGPIPWITVRLNAASESLVMFLERPAVVIGAICLSLVLLSVLSMAGSSGSSKVAANEMTSTNQTIDTSTAAPDPELAPPSPAPTEVTLFIIRVGAFRDPVNADRVVQSLRKQTLDVTTKIAGGLYVVTLGPFAARNAAEDAARSVREAVGVVPQILPTKASKKI